MVPLSVNAFPSDSRRRFAPEAFFASGEERKSFTILVLLRRLGESAELPNKLDGGIFNFLVSSRWLEIKERLDITAHGAPRQMILTDMIRTYFHLIF